MGDYEGVPAGWGWQASATPSELGDAVVADGGRLIAIHRPDGGESEPYTGVWVVDPEGEEVGWDWESRASASELGDEVANAGGRIVAIDPFIVDGAPAFAAVWVLGAAASAVDWGWAEDLSAADVRVRAEEARLICLSPYVVGGTRRYVAVWVLDDRSWDWEADIGFEDLRERLHDFPGRLVSLDPFLKAGELRFAAIWVDAADEFGKLWWWEVGSGEETVSMNAELFCSHLVEARRIPGAADAFAHFRHGFPRPPYAEDAQLVRVTGDAELKDVTDFMAPFDQSHELSTELINISGGPVEILEADVLTSICGWSHPAEPFSLFDMFPGQPTTMAAGDSYSGKIDHNWGPMPTHYVVRVRARAGDGRTQLLHAVIPIVRQNFLAPEDIEASVPVYLGVWTRPLEVVPIWHEGNIVNWLTIGGAVVNNTGQTLRIGGLHVTLEAQGDILDDRELPPTFLEFTGSNFETFESVPPPTTAAHAELPSRFSYFVHGFALPDEYDPGSGVDATLVLNYKLMDGWCGAATVRTTARHTERIVVRSPVREQWHWGNSAMHTGFDAHAWPGQRYALDMTVRDANGSTFNGDAKENTSYFAYGEPVHAVAKGTVLVCEFGQTGENSGNEPADPPPPWPGNNWVLLSHDAGATPRRSGYYHLRPEQPDPDHDMQPGDVVEAGQVIGFVGNIGASSQPHLHWGWAEIDWTGRCRTFPVHPRGLKTPDGDLVTSVPADGEYVS